MLTDEETFCQPQQAASGPWLRCDMVAGFESDSARKVYVLTYVMPAQKRGRRCDAQKRPDGNLLNSDDCHNLLQPSLICLSYCCCLKARKAFDGCSPLRAALRAQGVGKRQ